MRLLLLVDMTLWISTIAIYFQFFDRCCFLLQTNTFFLFFLAFLYLLLNRDMNHFRIIWWRAPFSLASLMWTLLTPCYYFHDGENFEYLKMISKTGNKNMYFHTILLIIFVILSKKFYYCLKKELVVLVLTLFLFCFCFFWNKLSF